MKTSIIFLALLATFTYSVTGASFQKRDASISVIRAIARQAESPEAAKQQEELMKKAENLLQALSALLEKQKNDQEHFAAVIAHQGVELLSAAMRGTVVMQPLGRSAANNAVRRLEKAIDWVEVNLPRLSRPNYSRAASGPEQIDQMMNVLEERYRQASEVMDSFIDAMEGKGLSHFAGALRKAKGALDGLLKKVKSKIDSVDIETRKTIVTNVANALNILDAILRVIDTATLGTVPGLSSTRVVISSLNSYAHSLAGEELQQNSEGFTSMMKICGMVNGAEYINAASSALKSVASMITSMGKADSTWGKWIQTANNSIQTIISYLASIGNVADTWTSVLDSVSNGFTSFGQTIADGWNSVFGF